MQPSAARQGRHEFLHGCRIRCHGVFYPRQKDIKFVTGFFSFFESVLSVTASASRATCLKRFLPSTGETGMEGSRAPHTT